jgi:uncharacterized Zn finger protein
MVSFTQWNGMKIECAHCGADYSHVHMHILWANQNGGGVRLFCQSCGHVTDMNTGKDGYTVTKRDMLIPETNRKKRIDNGNR